MIGGCSVLHPQTSADLALLKAHALAGQGTSRTAFIWWRSLTNSNSNPHGAAVVNLKSQPALLTALA